MMMMTLLKYALAALRGNGAMQTESSRAHMLFGARSLACTVLSQQLPAYGLRGPLMPNVRRRFT